MRRIWRSSSRPTRRRTSCLTSRSTSWSRATSSRPLTATWRATPRRSSPSLTSTSPCTSQRASASRRSGRVSCAEAFWRWTSSIRPIFPERPWPSKRSWDSTATGLSDRSSSPIDRSSSSSSDLQEVVVAADVLRLVVGKGRQHQADGPGGEVDELAPDQLREEQPDGGLVQLDRAALTAVVQHDTERAHDRDVYLLELPVRVAPSVSARHDVV